MVGLDGTRFFTHRDCANFRNGICTLNGVAVNPDGVACPRFTSKSITAIPQAVKAYPRASQPYQPYPPQTRQGYPAPQYCHEYIHPLLYICPPQKGYGYRIRYNSIPVSSVLTAPMQGGVGALSLSGGRRGGGGGGRGRMRGFAAGPGGSCVCPRCGYSMPHVVGTPCYQQICPKCGSRMTRGS